MAETGERGLSPLQAFEAVMGFARRRGEAALRLALHAAVPQVMHADLLHLLCVNFVGSARHSGVIETDVMFSPFCTDLGNGYFRFDDNARLQLLQQLDPGHAGRGEPRSLQVADFLLAWFERQLASERGDVDPLYRSWIEVERWNALAFRDPSATAEQLAAAVQQACGPGQTSARLRLGTLASSLAPQLMQHQRLLRYAAGVEAVQSGAADATALLRALGNEALQVGTVSLPPAATWLAMPLADNAATAEVPAEPAAEGAPAGATGGTVPLQRLPSLADCDFTAYISHSPADDQAWFSWVTQFRNELERSLQALLRGVRLPRMHLSGGERAQAVGPLGEELAARLESSFALIVVVHDNYVQSEWCLQELEHFKALYGEEGLRSRVYLVALSQHAVASLTAAPAWRRIFGLLEPVWLPFYDPASLDRPLDIYMGPGLVSPAFRTPFEALRSDLAAKLKRSASAGQGPRAPATAAPVPQPRVEDPGVLFGFVPDAASTAAAEARAALQQEGVSTRQLTQDVVFDDFGVFADATHLVLPYDDQPLMLSSLSAGGHLELQREAWLRKGRPPDHLHWLDLRPPMPTHPARGAAAWVESQGLRPLRVEALVHRLQSASKAARESARRGVRIYIESNRHERTLWEPLGEALRQRWGRLAANQQPAPTLRCRGLPIDQIDDYPNLDDADGVVLLWGRKTSDALVAQINKVEHKMAPGRDAAPGVVALLMPPQKGGEPVPAWGWQVLRFDVSSEDSPSCLPDDHDELDRFLRSVIDHWRRRQEALPS